MKNICGCSIYVECTIKEAYGRGLGTRLTIQWEIFEDTVFVDFTAALKINSSRSYCSV